MENLAAQSKNIPCQPPAYEDAVKGGDSTSWTKSLPQGAAQESSGGMVVYVTVDPVDRPDDEQLVPGCEEINATQTDGETGLNWIGTSFSDRNVRRGFIRKVFLILMCQLAVTVGVVCLFIFCKEVNAWIRTPGNFWFYYAAYGIFLAIYIVLICCKNVRRQWPGNIICLSLFTLSLSCMAGTISSYHDTRIVVVAFGMTGAICLALAIFAIQTKIDFTLWSGLLFTFSMVVFLFGLYCILTGAILGFQARFIMTGVWAGLVALLFSMFLVFDIQQVIGGNSIELNPEEYVYGALHIYLDVVFLFLMILSCSGRSR